MDKSLRPNLTGLKTRLAGHVLQHYHRVDVLPAGRIRGLDPPLVRRVTDYVEAHLDRQLELHDLADIANQSPFHFAKSFKEATGSPPHVFLTARRMERALVLVRRSQLSIAQIARRVGFRSVSHFRQQFMRAWGTAPHLVRDVGTRPTS